MRSLIHYVPIITSVVALIFTIVLYQRWRQKPTATYLAWWMIGVLMYGVGTLTESVTTLYGWQPWLFRAWYISGALLGSAPLAQGTVYLTVSKRVANWLTISLLLFIAVAATCVLLTPINLALVEPYRLSGRVMAWQWVRAFSPFLNLYALIFLVGGALWSAWRYWRRDNELGTRVLGNISIAAGALLPGIGGSFARFGQIEVLYATELLGLLLIWLGYQLMVSDAAISIHLIQRMTQRLHTAQSKGVS